MNDKPREDAPDLAASPFEGDLDAELAASRPRSLPGPTLYLGAGILLVAGFIGGVQANKWMADDTPAGLPAAARPNGYGGFGANGANGATGATGATGPYGAGGGFGMGGGRPGSGGSPTVGTVTRIDGNTLYLRTMSGQTVKVTTGKTTKITVTADGKVSDLRSGAMVIVNGTAGPDGSITAGTVTEGGTGPRPR